MYTANWMTTAAGIGSVASGIGMILTAIGTSDYSQIQTAVGLVSAGLVGLFAKDAKK
jgi:hypothetical protein